MKPLVKLLLGLVILANAACSTPKIIRDSEYQTSVASFRSGDVTQAIERFPKKEKGGFVTSVEKSYLGFWAGEKENKALMDQVSTLDQRRYTSISREAEYFFYNESADGYIPAEHEIITMHMLNAMLFMRQEKWDQAGVEARKAVFFLQNYFRDDQDHFDDPALRIWLSGIWAALGEWNEAQVDLRRAYELSGNKALLPFINMTEPPKEYAIVFTGAGPEVKWTPAEPIPEFSNSTSHPPYEARFDTMPWYRRHSLRNTEIRDTVMKSNYMAQYYGLNTSVGAEKTVGAVATTSLYVTGIVLGGAIIIGGLSAAAEARKNSTSSKESDDAAGWIVGLGLAAGLLFFDWGEKVNKSVTASTDQHMKDGVEDLKTYRYVRYLPSWISVTDKYEIQTPQNLLTYLQSPKSKTKVQFIQDF